MYPAIARVTVFACMALSLSAVHAQTFPSKTLRIIVPYPPGGGVDFAARLVATRLADNVGQQVIVDNRPGGGTIIGTELLARAAPDGYTMMMANIAFGANPALHAKLPYDTLNDFAPVSLVALVPSILLVHPSLPARSVRDLVALAKANPGKLAYGSAGNGSLIHLTMEHFKSVAGLNIIHVPYKGAAPALSDLLGGQIPMTFIPGAPTLSNIKAGRLRPLGVTSGKRLPVLPDVPTMIESGYPGFELYDWEGLIAPGSTPAPLVARLSTEINRIMSSQEVRDYVANHGATAAGSTPEQLAERIRNEIALWTKVVKQSGMAVE